MFDDSGDEPDFDCDPENDRFDDNVFALGYYEGAKDAYIKLLQNLTVARIVDIDPENVQGIIERATVYGIGMNAFNIRQLRENMRDEH